MRNLARKVRIDKDAAAAAVRATAYTIVDPGAPDDGREIVHSVMGIYGADWDLHDVLALIYRSNPDHVQWREHDPRHRLRIRIWNGQLIDFEAPPREAAVTT